MLTNCDMNRRRRENEVTLWNLYKSLDEQKAKRYDHPMDEGRKRVLLIAAAILAARKLAQWDGRPSPASEAAISDAITTAERILSRIDNRWPAKAAKVELKKNTRP
jgi:hypothetical protein